MNRTKYLIRFDDICDTICKKDWEKVKDALRENNIRPILAVIPNNKSEQFINDDINMAFWDELKVLQNDGWTIALHGYDHQYLNSNSGLLGITQRSEFAGVSYEMQKSKISSGVKIFAEHGIVPKAWVAPAHSFDKCTLKVLKEYNISVVSDGLARGAFRKYGMLWIPCQLWGFERQTDGGLFTICIHLSKMNEADINNLCSNLAIFANDIIDFETACNQNFSKICNCMRLVENDIRTSKRKIKRFIKMWRTRE